MFEILENDVVCIDLVSKEQYYKDLYRSYDRKYGYDMCRIAGEGSQLGLKRSEETKEKMRRPCSEEKRRKISETLMGRPSPMKGKHCSEEARLKNIASHIGITRSKESRQKQSISISGEKHHMYGKFHSEEAKRKMSETRKKHLNEKRIAANANC